MFTNTLAAAMKKRTLAIKINGVVLSKKTANEYTWGWALISATGKPFGFGTMYAGMSRTKEGAEKALNSTISRVNGPEMKWNVTGEIAPVYEA
jgi:hypothetical protein